MGVLDFFRKKEKENKKGSGLLEQVYNLSSKSRYMSFEQFKNSDFAQDYEFVYTVIVAMLASHNQQFILANKDEDIFTNGEIDMKEALDVFVRWNRELKAKGANLTMDEFKQFVLLDYGDKNTYLVTLARAGQKQAFAQDLREQENSINSRYAARNSTYNGVADEYEVVRRGR